MIGIPGLVVLVALAAILEVRGYATRSRSERWSYLNALAFFAGAVVMTIVTAFVYDDMDSHLAKTILMTVLISVQAYSVGWLGFVAYVRPIYRAILEIIHVANRAD